MIKVNTAGEIGTTSRFVVPIAGFAEPDLPVTSIKGLSMDSWRDNLRPCRNGLLRELTEETVDAILGVAGPAADGSINIVDIRQLGGAFSRPPAFATAVGGRDAAFAYFALTVVPPGRNIADYSDAGESLAAALFAVATDVGPSKLPGSG